MSKYYEYKKNRESGIGGFEGLFFAFNQEQFKEGIAKVGATKDNKVVEIGAGGYILKNRLADFEKLVKDLKTGLKTKLRSKAFFYDAMCYELCNHEYCITMSSEAALEALNINEKWIEKNKLTEEYKKAKIEALKDC